MIISFSLQIIAVTTGVIISIFTVEKLGAISLPKPTPPVPRAPRIVKVVASSTPRTTAASVSVPARPFVVPRNIPSKIAEVHDSPEAMMLAESAPWIGSRLGNGVEGATGEPASVGLIPAPAPPPKAPPQQAVKPVQVGGAVLEAKIARRVIPVYPTIAKNARISGAVKLMGVISRDGRVINLQVIAGHPLLTTAALDAVRRWVYSPTLLNGQPVEVIAPIDVHFTLSQ